MFEKSPKPQEKDITTKIAIQKKETERKENPTKSFEKFTKEMLWDFALVKDKKHDYESTMEDIDNIYKVATETGSDESVADADRQIRARWVPLAREALTEWIDAETKFREKYGGEVRVELSQEQMSSKYDVLASEYGITEYSPEERKLAKKIIRRYERHRF